MSTPGTLTNLPIIDIGPFLTNDSSPEARATTAAALHTACLEYGFFYLNIEKYINFSEPEELTRLGRQFFSLSQEEKDKVHMKNEDHARGYARLNENITNGLSDNHEGLDLYKPVSKPDKTKPIWGENQWPSVPGFRIKFEAWIEKMKVLGMVVMEAMAQGLGMTKEEWQDLRNRVDDSFWVMRVIGYPPLPDSHEGISCGAHKDYGCLTFLYADPTPSALQVFLSRPNLTDVKQEQPSTLPREQGLEEGIWINADPLPGCVVCNIGEMWETWTNGLYRSTLHRVIHKGSNYRVSIPFFFEPNFDALIKPLPAADRIRKNEGAGKYIKPTQIREPVIYGQFLKGKVSNNFSNGYDDQGKGKND